MESISLIDTVPGEETAQSCAMACLTTVCRCAGRIGYYSLDMLRYLIRVPLVIVALFLVCGSSEVSNRPLLRALDGATSLLLTAGPQNFNNCVVVLPSGKFYLVLKRQEFGNTASLKKFEGWLDQRELRILRSVLDQDAVKGAPSFEIPRMPSVDEWEGFQAQIDRGSTVQLVGYFKWKLKGSDKTEPANKDSQDSEAALRPLVEWFRALKTYNDPLKRPASKSARFSCSFEDESKE
jgi:hypothetical protein